LQTHKLLNQIKENAFPRRKRYFEALFPTIIFSKLNFVFLEVYGSQGYNGALFLAAIFLFTQNIIIKVLISDLAKVKL